MLEHELADVFVEMDELAEVWLERHVSREDNTHLRLAIVQADKESRKIEHKLRKR